MGRPLKDTEEQDVLRREMFVKVFSQTHFICVLDCFILLTMSLREFFSLSFASSFFSHSFSFASNRPWNSSFHSLRIRFTSACEYFSTCSQSAPLSPLSSTVVFMFNSNYPVAPRETTSQCCTLENNPWSPWYVIFVKLPSMTSAARTCRYSV